MDDLDRYLANAAQADRLALIMPIPERRDELLAIAEEWRRLADEATARLVTADVEL